MTEFIPIGRISFMLFSDDSINFSASFPVHFCIFPSAYEKSAAFSIRIIRFLRFFRFVGIIFLAFSRAKLRNFSSHSVFIIFALFPGLFKGKILIFRNEFSVRTNIFSLPRGVFPDFFSCHPIKKTILPEYFSSHPAGIFTVPDLFRTNQTRAHLHARNNILITPPGSLSLIPENLP